MKSQFLFIVMCSLLCNSCVNIVRDLVNTEGHSYDVAYEFDVPETVWIRFGLSDDEDIKTYNSNPIRSRLKYSFSILCPFLPDVTLHSFSFTDEKGIEISSILYYRTDGRVVHIIDSLPVTFTNEIKKNMKHRSFEIFAECNQSYNETETVYVNYDIEVGDTRFVKQSKYSKKTFYDWRPKW